MTDSPHTPASSEIAIAVPNLRAEDLPIRVGCWLAEPGERVYEGATLVELQIPGIVYDVTTPTDGTLVRIECPNGAAVESGTLLGVLQPNHPDDPHPESNSV